MDATAVSAIARAQKDFWRPQSTDDISSKAHLDVSVERVKTRHGSTERCAYNQLSPANHLFLELQHHQTGLSPRFLQLICNTSTGRSLP